MQTRRLALISRFAESGAQTSSEKRFGTVYFLHGIPTNNSHIATKESDQHKGDTKPAWGTTWGGVRTGWPSEPWRMPRISRRRSSCVSRCVRCGEALCFWTSSSLRLQNACCLHTTGVVALRIRWCGHSSTLQRGTGGFDADVGISTLAGETGECTKRLIFPAHVWYQYPSFIWVCWFTAFLSDTKTRDPHTGLEKELLSGQGS